MKEWLEDFVKSLVSLPDQVAVSQKDGLQTVVLTIKVAEDDLSLFHGRNNRLIWALERAASLAGIRPRMRYVVKIV